jgi:hypothetical protein
MEYLKMRKSLVSLVLIAAGMFAATAAMAASAAPAYKVVDTAAAAPLIMAGEVYFRPAYKVVDTAAAAPLVAEDDKVLTDAAYRAALIKSVFGS